MNWTEETNYPLIERAIEQCDKQYDDFIGWAIQAKFTRSLQSLMMAKNENLLSEYQVREVVDTEYKVTLYVTNDDGSQTGASTATLQQNGNYGDQLRHILGNARLAMNPSYPLPPKPTLEYPVVESSCPSIRQDIITSHRNLIKRIRDHAASLSSVIINSAELYTNVHEFRLQSSTGIQVQKTTTDVYFEVAMERAPGPNLQEVLKYWHFVGLDDANVEERLDAVADEAQLTTYAEVPPARSHAVVLVDSYAISKFAAAISSQLKSEAEYVQGPHLKPGDRLASSERDAHSDKLTLSVDPSLKQMAKTSAYTEEGLVAKKADLIINNEVKHQLLDTRFGHYLGKPANGYYGNFVIPPGSSTRQALLASHDEVIEILDFSSLLVNASSLTWSSEIKLGRLYKNGQPSKTLKGGIVSGNIRDSLSGFKFSSEQTRRNTAGGYFESASGYQGPEYMLMWTGISIAGNQEQEAL